MSQFNSAAFNSNAASSAISSVSPAMPGVIREGMTIQDLMLIMTLNSLQAQDSTFETLFQECEQRTKQLTAISTVMQILGKYRDHFDKDGKPIKDKMDGNQTWLSQADREALKAAGIDDLLKSGLVPGLEKVAGDGVWGKGGGWDGFTKGSLDTALENLKLTQGQISSVNEQQMMRANQSANKRSTILQFGQSLLQSIKEAQQASAR